jgi:hypothetical protein
MLSDSLDCPFLIAPLVFSDIDLQTKTTKTGIQRFSLTLITSIYLATKIHVKRDHLSTKLQYLHLV